MRKSIYFVSLLITLLLFTGCTLSQQASQPLQVDQFVPPAAAVAAAQSGSTTVKIQLATTNLKVGETVNADIVIENVANLNGADIEVKFNPAVLKGQDGDPAKDGLQVKGGPFISPDFVVMNKIDNATGLAQYAVVQLPSSAPASGTGVVFSIVFEAIANGSTDLALTKMDLPSSNNTSVPATPINGQITVGEGGNPLPTTVPATTVPPTAEQPTTVPPTDVAPTAVVPTEVAPPTAIVPTAMPTEVVPPTAVPTIVVDPPTPIVPTATPGTVPPPTPIVTPETNPTEPVIDVPWGEGNTTGFCYRVQPGDTLYSLGERFGLHYSDIALANDLWSSDHILINQALFIPEHLGTGPNFYITRAGDTLGSIAEQCHLPVDFLARRNGYDVTESVPTGEVLFIPIPPFPPVSHVGPRPYRPVGPFNGGSPCCCNNTQPYPAYAGPCTY